MLNLGDVFADLGVDYLSATEDPRHPIFQKMFSAVVDLTNHECNSTVCHRITFMYGHLYRHERLNTATHDRLGEQFGAVAHVALPLLRAALVRRADEAERFCDVHSPVDASVEPRPADDRSRSRH